jgi:hypothetical protein
MLEVRRMRIRVVDSIMSSHATMPSPERTGPHGFYTSNTTIFHTNYLMAVASKSPNGGYLPYGAIWLQDLF